MKFNLELEGKEFISVLRAFFILCEVKKLQDKKQDFSSFIVEMQTEDIDRIREIFKRIIRDLDFEAIMDSNLVIKLSTVNPFDLLKEDIHECLETKQ